MDLLNIIGEQLPSHTLEENILQSKGEVAVFEQIYASQYNFETAYEELLDTLNEMEDTDNTYLSMESWDAGMEGIISDLWFKFVQFVKRVVGHIRVMIEHLITGMSGKLVYMNNKRVDMRGNVNLNWAAMEGTVMKAYTKQDFDDLLTALKDIHVVLSKTFKETNVDIDGVRSFERWGISFIDGMIEKRGLEGDSRKFDLGYEQRSLVPLGKMGWTRSSLPDALDKFVPIVESDIEKDYLYVDFQSAMAKLIRTVSQYKSGLSPEEREEKSKLVRTLTNRVRSIASIMSYATVVTSKMSMQMVATLKALETPFREERDGSVY